MILIHDIISKTVFVCMRLILFIILNLGWIILHNYLYYRFRRQHEQLRTVIVRVLRPSVVPRSQQPVGTPISEDTSESKTDSLDAADINAIEVWYKECLILSVMFRCHDFQSLKLWKMCEI